MKTKTQKIQFWCKTTSPVLSLKDASEALDRDKVNQDDWYFSSVIEILVGDCAYIAGSYYIPTEISLRNGKVYLTHANDPNWLESDSADICEGGVMTPEWCEAFKAKAAWCVTEVDEGDSDEEIAKRIFAGIGRPPAEVENDLEVEIEEEDQE